MRTRKKQITVPRSDIAMTPPMFARVLEDESTAMRAPLKKQRPRPLWRRTADKGCSLVISMTNVKDRSKSDPGGSRSGSCEGSMLLAAELPWGAVKLVPTTVLDHSASSGQFAAQSLLVEFVQAVDRKLQQVGQHETLEKLLNKSLQRGEDVHFDNILRALNGVSEHCLPSVLTALISWYEQQQHLCIRLQQTKLQSKNDGKPPAKNEPPRPEARDFYIEKRALAVDFLFCLVLIEILPQLHFHPRCDDQINYIITLAFKQFKYRDPVIMGPNYNNCLIVAETYAEVIGVLSQSHFVEVQRHFTRELTEMRRENPPTPLTTHNIIGLLMGMKFFRIKTNQVVDLETGVLFLHELGQYYLEVKQRDIKHAIAGLLVEILLPVAAQVKTETNIPSLIAFVDKLYAHTLDLANKKHHKMAAYPLQTCLLCISQTKFFLNNWHQFLTQTLASLKNRDPKMSRVALESLYRLLWVYVIRIGCEGNTATHSRLQSICSSLFPRGNRYVVPRDAPLNIFVKIIHFIAQQKLDFAFKEIIFDLLGCGRPVRNLYPERMNIGIRALMVIADGLQQKEGPPGMPRSMGPVASGTFQRYKKTYITRPLTADVARTIGLDHYYGPCRKSFDGILRALDAQVGRPLMLTVLQSRGKEPDELLGGDSKPKLDLFRTCVAAVPRLLPDGMSHVDLIDLLTRMTVHMDEELRAMACQTLQNLMGECADWREDIVHGYLQFLARDVQDTYPSLLDNALRLLLQLICTWKLAVNGQMRKEPPAMVADAGPANRVQVSPLLGNGIALALHCIEGMALVMLCQCRQLPRKIAVNILKEIKALLPIICNDANAHERPVIDVLDAATPFVIGKYIEHVSQAERAVWLSNPHLDFMWMCEKIPGLETDCMLVNPDKGNEYMRWDPWACALSGFTEPQFLLSQCATATTYAWPIIHARLNACYNFVDPSNPQNETRASLLRSSKSKATAPSICGESLTQENYLSLWQKYLVVCCALAPPPGNSTNLARSFSPSTTHGDNNEYAKALEVRIPRVANVTAASLFQKLVPMLRWEQLVDMRDIVVWGLGSVNPASFECLLDELGAREVLREAADRKQENLRRRKRRDLLRLQLIRLIEVVVFRGTLPLSCSVDAISGQLKPVMVDLIDSARQYLESDLDRDLHSLTAMRLHFSKMVALLINGFPADRRLNLIANDKKQNLFYLFTSWCSRSIAANDRKYSRDRDSMTWVEQRAVEAMCAVLCCGPIFEPTKALGDDGYLYPWLEALLTSQHEMVSALSEETLALMLDYNDQTGHLLEWTIERCYTMSARVADKCFRALTAVFSQREYPCDVVTMFCLTLMFSGYPVTSTAHMAVELFQVLEQRFLDDDRMSMATTAADHDVSDESLISEHASNGRSQRSLSQHLAEEHPEMTMPMFSEVSSRLETAKPARRTAMLRLLLPWMRNMELVDPNLESAREVMLTLAAKIAESQAIGRRVLKGDGWGSAQATELILNNMLYMTVKFGNEHGDLLEQLWVTLVQYWPHNLRIVLRYLFVMTVLSPDTLLPYAKRITVYLAAANAERIVEELINELQANDAFKYPLERSDLPPYYRWVGRNASSPSPKLEQQEAHQDGQHYLRRHAQLDDDGAAGHFDADADDDVIVGNNANTSASMASLVTLKAEMVNAKATSPVVERAYESDKPSGGRRREHHNPFQLPMPAYGGYYATLTSSLPPTAQPVSPVQRSNLSLILLTDLVIADIAIDWTLHLPLIVHSAVLGLDSIRPLVHDHCKRVLVNLIVAHSRHMVPTREVASVLLTNQLAASQLSLASNCNRSLASTSSRFDTVNSQATTALVGDTGTTNSAAGSRAQTPAPSSLSASTSSMRPRDAKARVLFNDSLMGRFHSVHELVVSMMATLTEKTNAPLWPSEDVTARNWRTESGEQLNCFVSHLADLFGRMLPTAQVESRWAQTAIDVALNCSNRHYAGRSFQIFRALKTAPTSRMLSDVLSRLAETVGEQTDDMQGYVTEIMLTLQTGVIHMEAAEHALHTVRACLDESPPANHHIAHVASPTHARSTSYTSALLRRSPAVDRKDVRNSMGAEELHAASSQANNLPRSKSAQALKSVPEGQEEHMAAMSQLFWIATSMLESDFEHEYLLALHLLDKMIDLPGFERNDCLERLDRMVKQLSWSLFPGLLPLLLKGTIFPAAYDLTISLLTKMLPLLGHNVVDAKGDGFSFIVMAVLPNLVLHFDNPTKLCIAASEAITEHCLDTLESMREHGTGSGTTASGGSAEHPLEHLSMMMRQYSKRVFSRDGFQWTKCVVKYLNDACCPNSSQLLVMLAEMLERAAPVLSLPVLQIIYCMFHHIELAAASPVTLNADVMRAVSRHIQGPHWRDAARIMKLVVLRSSSLMVTGGGSDGDDVRRELPGRTMDFCLDMSAVSLALSHKDTVAAATTDSVGLSPKKSISVAHVSGDSGSLRRQTNVGQVKVREHLISLLNASGLRVGLPKSPSVIFSQSSHDIAAELPSSVYSSSGELAGADGSSTPSPGDQGTLGTDYTSDSFPRVFKEFDFLEAEHDSVSESADSCFNWLSTMRPRSISNAEDDGDLDLSPAERPPSVAGTAVSSSDRTPLDSGASRHSDEDSTDEDESVGSQTEENSTAGRVNVCDMANLFVQDANAAHEARPTTPSTQSASRLSLCGSLGTPSIDWLGWGSLPLFGLECTHHATGQIEESWTLNVQDIMTDQEGTMTANAMLMFTQLYREACVKVSGLLRDACHVLSSSMSDVFRDVSSQFFDALDVLMKIGDCPFMFVTAQLLRATNTLQKQRFGLFELREHYETFQERREHCIRTLNVVKSGLKLALMGGGQRNEENTALDQEIDLCRCLHKLFFQLLLMSEAFHTMMLAFTVRPLSDTNDLSAEVRILQRDLLCAVHELTTGSAQETGAANASGDAVGTLVQLMRSKQYKTAIQHLRIFRNQQNKLDVYGCCEDEDVEVLLLLFCRTHADAFPCSYAVIGSEATLADNCHHLKETNLQLSSIVRNLSTLTQPTRHSRLSSMANACGSSTSSSSNKP
uniref:Protein furry n=1 Tax=Plectus sambesii TaxID=2011161 RepID=A0A914W2H8_9BILA